MAHTNEPRSQRQSPVPSPAEYAAHQPTNGFAITALISSLVLAPLGIVFGHLALNQIKKSGESGRGLAIGGLVIGYLTTAIWVICIIAFFTVIDTAHKAIEDSQKASISTGTWEGTFEYPAGQRIGMTFTVTNSDPVSGAMVFGTPGQGTESCEVSVKEQSRSWSTVTVVTEATSGSSDCANSGRWEIEIDSSRLTGKLVWSSSGNLIGSHMDLRQR